MKKLFAAIVVALSVAACGPQIPQLPQIPAIPQVGEQQQQAPAAQQGSIDGSSAALGAVAGGLVGYMAGKSGSSNNTTIIERERPGYGNNYGSSYNSRGRTTVTTTTVKKGMFGGTKTITRTTRTRR